MEVHQVPELVDDAVEEVLVRCPPGDPARLHCASLVCKRWRRIVSAAAFRRRYAERHRVAQPLGFVCNFAGSFVPSDGGGDDTAHFVSSPLSTFHPPSAAAAHRNMRALDVRHGRVLLHDMVIDPISVDKMHLVVWDPITGEHREVPRIPVVAHPSCWNAAVLCAAGDGCDHLSCHRGHFKVVVVGVHPKHSYAYSCVYSSEPSGSWPWSARTTAPLISQYRSCRFHLNPSALVGNALHFVFQTNVGTGEILKYDLATEDMSVVNLPPTTGFHRQHIVLLTTEDGGWGSAIVDQSKLHMWSRVDGHSDGGAEWYQSGVIDLEKLLPAFALKNSPAAVGFAGVGVIFLATHAGNFVVDLNSTQVRKLGEGRMFYSVFPFSSFSIPGPS